MLEKNDFIFKLEYKLLILKLYLGTQLLDEIILFPFSTGNYFFPH